MSARANVRRDGDRDWVAECRHHDEIVWCGDWLDAMEAAWGHVAMHHGRGLA